MAAPPKTINVLMIVDTEATQSGRTTVYMVDDNSDASQGSSELTINAKVGDLIKWRVTGILPDTNPILDQFVRTAGDDVLGGVAFINGVWQATVLRDGQETYHWVFSINGRGHYTWDPYIHVT